MKPIPQNTEKFLFLLGVIIALVVYLALYLIDKENKRDESNTKN